MAVPTMQQLLKVMVDNGASDLHISRDSPPQLRIDGDLVPLKVDPMTAPDTKMLCYSILTDSQKQKFEEDKEIDLSFDFKGMARFRANIFLMRGAVAGAFRAVPSKVIPLENMGMPPVIEELCNKPRGLVLVTGPTGSGKSTTLASMIDRINQQQHGHILTIEDPIEFVHTRKNCLINQRELGSDTKSFTMALRSILRQDPDYVLVGELRDKETIEAALAIAETGHMCFGTLHTNGAIQSINRIIDVFEPHQQPQIRAVLSFVLEGVISQALMPKASGQGRALACEIMIPTPAIRNLIREDKLHQIYSQMQIGQTKFGMQTFNQSLADLVIKRVVTPESALAYSSEPDELRVMLSTGKSSANDSAVRSK